MPIINRRKYTSDKPTTSLPDSRAPVDRKKYGQETGFVKYITDPEKV